MTKDEALERKAENARELGLDYEPEPERFLVATIGNWGRVEWADGVFPSLGNKLYSAPPKWVGLTDEEIWGAVSRIGTSNSDVNPYAILKDARAIEAKLRSKNGY